MFVSLSRALRACAAVAAFVLFSSPATAGMDQVMQDMFDAMINVTPGGVYQTQQRGVVAGGSIYYRAPVANAQLFAVTPPSIRSNGCGATDIYGGSFSFISADQLVNLMKSIAANAIPYAFKLALTTLCTKCEQMMSQLQKLADEMNKFNINSCRALRGEYGASWLTDRIQATTEATTAIFNTAQGIASDMSAAVNDPVRTATGMLRNSNPVLAEENGPINIAWEILTKNSLGTWYRPGMSLVDTTDFAEIVMSYTGTIIQRWDTDTNGTETLKTDPPLQPTLSFLEFMNGAQQVQVYRCGADPKCLSPTPTTTNFVGMRIIVRNALMGPTGNDGLLARLNARNGAGDPLTAADMKFIEAMPGGVFANLRNLAVEPFAARMYAESVIDYIAMEMATSLLMDVLGKVQGGLVTVERRAAVDDFSKMLMARRDETLKERTAVNQSMQSAQMNLDIYQKIRDNIQQAKNKVYVRAAGGR